MPEVIDPWAFLVQRTSATLVCLVGGCQLVLRGDFRILSFFLSLFVRAMVVCALGKAVVVWLVV